MSVSAFLDSCRNNAAKQLVDFVATLEITVTSDDISGLITRVKKGFFNFFLFFHFFI